MFSSFIQQRVSAAGLTTFTGLAAVSLPSLASSFRLSWFSSTPPETKPRPVSDAVQHFWLNSSAAGMKLWFNKDDTVDQHVSATFSDAVQQANQGKFDDWLDNPRDALSLVILLDQFPRNIYRGTPQSFAHDAKAVWVAKESLKRGHDKQTTQAIHRMFFYLPFEHAEDVALQAESVRLFRVMQQEAVELSEDDAQVHGMLVQFAEKHQEFIQRFGRFPHRNAILNRQSTPEELEFLETPGSSF